MSTQFKFKNDKFKKNRDGPSRWLLLSCEKCKNQLLIYQKDGLGVLMRLYLDRIVFPRGMNPKMKLECKKCKTVLGLPIIFKKEKRPAYRLFAYAIEKKIIKTNELSRLKF
jgi:ribosomal protein S27E